MFFQTGSELVAPVTVPSFADSAWQTPGYEAEGLLFDTCPYQSLGPRAVMAEFLFRLASEDPGRTLFARRHQDPSRSQNVRRLKSSGDAGRIWVVTGKPTKEEAGMRPLRQSPQRLEGSAANATPTWSGKWMGT